MAHAEAGSREWARLGGSLPNLQPGLSGFSRRPLSAWSPCCYVGLISLSSASVDTTVSLGGRGSCGLAVFTGALMMVARGS
jgi:hypothetical protein